MKDASQKTDHFTAFRRWFILLLLPLQCRLLTLGEHTFFFFYVFAGSSSIGHAETSGRSQCR